MYIYHHVCYYEHEFEVNRATFSRFKKKYNLTDNDKDPRARQKEALAKRAITQKQITDNNIHKDNIDLDIDSILQQQVTDIKTGLENLDKITKNAVGLEIDFEKLDREVRYNANEKSLARYLIDITELKIRYLELFIKVFEAKNRLFKNRAIEPEDKKIEILQNDIINEIEILTKQIMMKTTSSESALKINLFFKNTYMKIRICSKSIFKTV